MEGVRGRGIVGCDGNNKNNNYLCKRKSDVDQQLKVELRQSESES